MNLCVDSMTVRRVNKELKEFKKKYKTVHLKSKATKSGMKTYIVYY